MPNPAAGVFHDYVIIEKGMLTYKGSITSLNKNISFNLKNITKLLLRKREVSCWSKGGKLDFWACLQRAGTEIELSLLDIEGKVHVLIPTFRFYQLGIEYVNRKGQQIWNRFLNELCEYSGLNIEETT